MTMAQVDLASVILPVAACFCYVPLGSSILRHFSLKLSKYELHAVPIQTFFLNPSSTRCPTSFVGRNTPSNRWPCQELAGRTPNWRLPDSNALHWKGRTTNKLTKTFI